MKTHLGRKLLLFSTLFFAGYGGLFANTYTVTSTANSGAGTLRQAITDANANAGYDVINFNIATGGGNTFETSGANSWAIITLTAALPTITETVLINGTTQTNTNTGFIAGRTVGVDGIVQGNINYPDVYITRTYALPADDVGTTGNGLSVNAANVTIRGLAISGFGNTNTSQPTGIAHADISILHSATARTMNTVILDCFLSCDPRGGYPTIAGRRSLSNGVLILANNNFGTVERNYISHSGGYGVVFHGTQDNVTATSPNLMPCTNWLIEENQVINIGRSTAFLAAGGRAADGISLMNTRYCLVQNNYVADWEQFGIDLGHNTDDNRVENNTLTGFVKTNGSAPVGGIRTGFSSERDTLSKNEIYGNNSTVFLSGIWADESQTSFAGAVVKNNNSFYYSQNEIYNNTNSTAGSRLGSGIALSTNGAGTLTMVTMTQNSFYNNTGLGIDLNFNGVTGPTSVTVNDDGDGDGGTNNRQNFPIIEQITVINSPSAIEIWGKGPAGATMEFFVSDGGSNNHGGLGLNYGEGRTYIGSRVEGSGLDWASGTGQSYNIDGNVASGNVNSFRFYFPLGSLTINQVTDRITATATVGDNTSEFGPQSIVNTVLSCMLLDFTGSYGYRGLTFNWTALCDNDMRYFVVEESADGNAFFTLGEVRTIKYGKEAGYDFNVYKTLNGTGFYRLRMVDKNGKATYSRVLRLTTSGQSNETLKVTPNPFTDHVVTQLKLGQAAQITVSIADVTGRIVKQKTVQGRLGDNSFTVDELNALQKGTYTVRVEVGSQHYTQKILKR